MTSSHGRRILRFPVRGADTAEAQIHSPSPGKRGWGKGRRLQKAMRAPTADAPAPAAPNQRRGWKSECKAEGLVGKTLTHVVGETLDSSYYVTDNLGKGGMGKVYQAIEGETARSVAIKMVSDEVEAENMALAVRSLRREIDALLRLSGTDNEGIVRFLARGSHGGADFLVMEHLDGSLLSEILNRRGWLPWEDARRIMSQVCGALSAVHERDMIYADLKPENLILVRQEYGEDIVKLFDFGLVGFRDAHTGGYDSIVGGDKVFGTLEYMSPEQTLAQPLDHRTDIWAAGVTLFEMLTGRTPFEADAPEGTFIKIRSSPTPRILGTALAAVNGIISKATAKNPEDRFQSMGEMRSALESI